MKCRQGEIWWANLPPPSGRRPVLVLTRTDAIKHLTGITVAPLTSTIRAIDSEAVLSAEDGVPSTSAISLDNILTIRKTSLERRITVMERARMSEVFAAIRFAFDMPEG